MKKIYFYILLILSTALSGNRAYAQPPENLSCAKRAVIAYYTSGEYEKDVKSVAQDAENYLQKRLIDNRHSAKPQKLAMVLDIDDTSISNFSTNKERDFSGLPALIHTAYLSEKATPVKPVLNLYNMAIKNNVAVFFLTFRPDTVRASTIGNLQKAGYHHWTALYMPNNKETKLPVQDYKTGIRKIITQNGYDIILNLGDQDSDLAGGYAEHTDKIPNPIYLVTAGGCSSNKVC